LGNEFESYWDRTIHAQHDHVSLVFLGILIKDLFLKYKLKECESTLDT